jgi:hypothetical protein
MSSIAVTKERKAPFYSCPTFKKVPGLLAKNGLRLSHKSFTGVQSALKCTEYPSGLTYTLTSLAIDGRRIDANAGEDVMKVIFVRRLYIYHYTHFALIQQYWPSTSEGCIVGCIYPQTFVATGAASS